MAAPALFLLCNAAMCRRVCDRVRRAVREEAVRVRPQGKSALALAGARRHNARHDVLLVPQPYPQRVGRF